MKILWLIGILIGVVIGAAYVSASKKISLQHSIYIWQQRWTPELVASLDFFRADLHELRVLAGEFTLTQKLRRPDVDFSALKRANLKTYAVIRIDGRTSDNLSPANRNKILQIVDEWRTQIPGFAGVEIDYDCPESQLKNYAEFLTDLRKSLPANVRLSNTSLPSWLHSADLPQVLQQSDESVLQVHAVLNPDQGLFNRELALKWIKAYQTISPKEFSVALPAYGSRVGFSEEGSINTIQSEQPLFANPVKAIELKVDPISVANFLVDLQRNHQPRIVWFRLPSLKDERSWSPKTLQAVMRQRSLSSHVEPVLVIQAHQVNDSSQLFRLELKNQGNMEIETPEAIKVATTSHCTSADGLDGYSVKIEQSSWVFVRNSLRFLKPDQQIGAGWLHCDSSVKKDDFYVHFQAT